MIHGHVLVTGALGGIGTAMVRRFVGDGYCVIACDRREADATDWLKAFPDSQRESVSFYPLDVTRLSEVEELAEVLRKDDIEVAYLINNAGIQGARELWDLSPRVWDIVIRVNLYGTFHFTRTFSQPMIRQEFGRIVNLASLYAYHPGPGQAAYAAAKAGIVGFTHSTALDFARHGITVNVIAPGLIWHERLREVVSDSDRKSMLANIPAGRVGSPEEIAATVAFLLSEEAGFMTGQTLHVNGGSYLTG